MEAVIDPAMGNLRALKNWELAVGTIELVSGIDVLKEERVQTPPSEIVSLLEKDPGPKFFPNSLSFSEMDIGISEEAYEQPLFTS